MPFKHLVLVPLSITQCWILDTQLLLINYIHVFLLFLVTGKSQFIEKPLQVLHCKENLGHIFATTHTACENYSGKELSVMSVRSRSISGMSECMGEMPWNICITDVYEIPSLNNSYYNPSYSPKMNFALKIWPPEKRLSKAEEKAGAIILF